MGETFSDEEIEEPVSFGYTPTRSPQTGRVAV
jgi:hypothetical protein